MSTRLLLPLVLWLAACDGNTVKLGDDTSSGGDDSGVSTADADGDGFSVEDGDCDDSDPGVYPGAEELGGDGVDNNCDGQIDEGFEDADGDGFTAAEGDCDDADGAVYPGAEEVCDGVDNDCDGEADVGASDASTWYADADADGYGDAGLPTQACDAPSGYVADDTDCDDSQAASNPGAQEICDGLDNDCDGLTDSADDSVDTSSVATWYPDTDGDGFGDGAGATLEQCDQPSGYVLDTTDCDDTNPDQGGPETWYADADGDGYGDAADTQASCDQPSGYVADGADCDDTDAAVSPEQAWYADADGDGYGDAADVATACGQAPSGYVGDDTDCDDTDAAVSPGADEYCDGVDNNCDGQVDELGAVDGSTWYVDDDGDGYGDPSGDTTACDQPTGYVSDDTDCDDTDVAINPGADEVCDGADNDCDGYTDDDDPEGPTDPSTWYADADGDGYGDASAATALQCDAPSGYVADNTDCDDTDSSVSPAAAEISYDAIDNDCNGFQDDMIVGDEALFTVVGVNNNDHIGEGGVTFSDDLNGDGDKELLIGVPDDDNRRADAGGLAFHDVDTLGTDVNYDDGWLLVLGDERNDEGAAQFVLLGDVDADGAGELAMSAPGSDRESNNGGIVWFFDVDGLSGEQRANSIRDGRVEGREAGERLGEALAVGDLDADGGLDIVMGATGSDSGTVYIAWHADDYFDRDDDTWDMSYVLEGAASGDALGTALRVPGDVDSDGYEDLIACAPGEDSAATDAGACYLLLGGTSMSGGAVTSVASATVQGSAAYDEIGGSPFSLGELDVDADGDVDVVFGVPGYDGSANGGGAVFIFDGGALSGTVGEADAAFVIDGGGALGVGMASGDVSGDGAYADLLLGASSEGSGMLYLWAGGQAAGSYTLGGAEYGSWEADGSSDQLGATVGGPDDLDGDGQQEFVVSASSNSDGSNNGGKVYVLPTW